MCFKGPGKTRGAECNGRKKQERLGQKLTKSPLIPDQTGSIKQSLQIFRQTKQKKQREDSKLKMKKGTSQQIPASFQGLLWDTVKTYFRRAEKSRRNGSVPTHVHTKFNSR